MLRVGLTGGIGSGKSTVARIFEVLGIPVFYADDAAKRLMSSSEHLRNEIIRNFGEGSYSGNELNRQHIAGIVFNNPEEMAKLNAIVHPAVLLDAKNWLDAQETPYAIKEAALIFEAGADKDLDFVIGVSSPLPLRIRRIMERDNISEKEIISRMKKQMDEVEKMKRCDFILVNNEVQLLTPQVLELHEKLFLKSGN